MPSKARITLAVAVLVVVSVPHARATGPYITNDPYQCSEAPAPYGFSTDPSLEDFQDCEPQPWIAFSGELLWLDRTKASRQTFMFADIAGNPLPIMDVRDLLFEVKSGVRIKATLGAANGHRVELAYAGVFDQIASGSRTSNPAQIAGLNSVSYLFFGTTQGGAFSYTADYESTLHSTEVNWVLPTDWGIRPLVGARWIRQSERFDIVQSLTPNVGTTSELDNDLFGAQIGFQMGLWDRGEWFRVEATAKAGVYQNAVSLYADSHTAAGPTQMFEREFQTTSYASEVNVTAIWQFSKNASLQIGYTGLWLTDVGLAPDQSDNFSLTTGQGELDVERVLYNGGHFGLEVIW